MVVTRPTREKVAAENWMCPKIRNTVRKYTRNESEMKGDENQSEIRKAPRKLKQRNPKIKITGRKFKVIRKFDWTKISEFCQKIYKIYKTNIKFKQPKNSLQYRIQ